MAILVINNLLPSEFILYSGGIDKPMPTNLFVRRGTLASLPTLEDDLSIYLKPLGSLVFDNSKY